MGRVLDRAAEIEAAGGLPGIRPSRAQKAPPSPVTEELAAHRVKLLAEAERIFARRLDEIDFQGWHGTIRYHFYAPELLVFDSLGWDKQEIKRQASLLQTRRDWQRRAGTGAEQLAARNALEAAQAEFQQKSPAIEEQIRKLTSQLNSLENVRASAQAVVECHTRAAEKLREIAPEAIREQYESLMFVALKPITSEIADHESWLSVTRAAIACNLRIPRTFDRDDRLKARDIAMGALPEAVRSAGDGSGFVDDGIWHEWVAGRRAEMPAVESRLATLIAERDAILLEASAMLEWWPV